MNTMHRIPFRTGPAPRIETVQPDPGNRNGMGLVIFPGGGYHHWAEHEGPGYAAFYREEGFTCFVVRYRLGTDGHRHPAMLEDALFALLSVRERAGALGIDPARIGVVGSSAGGHLAAHTLVAHGRYGTDPALRPAFGILCYPVITMRAPYAHARCRDNLLGENPPESLIDEVSCERLVTPEAPPCFLWHTGGDPGVPLEHSLAFVGALRANGVPFELHLYPGGRHGMGLNTEFPWARDSVRWLRSL